MANEVTVLAVDDDTMNLNMLELMLSDLGYTVLKAGDGQQALKTLEAYPHIDVVLLDLEMPIMDGYETIKRIKQNQKWCEIPVIVVTNGANEVSRTLSLGANDFIAKPYNSGELRLRIMNHVRNNYDKIGHLAQGFVPALIIREIFVRMNIINKKSWQSFIIVSICMAISVTYEFIEWLVSVLTGESGDSFLGTQGYIWDTQSDMLFASIGAVIGLLIFSRLHDKQIAEI